jgi:hypothetical protein
MNLRIASIIFNNEDEKETEQRNKIKANIRFLVGTQKLKTTMQDNEKPKSLHAREDLIHDRFECVDAELTAHISTLTKAMRHSHRSAGKPCQCLWFGRK